MAARQGILADTSGVIALLDRDDLHHTAALQVVQTETIWIPSTILPEVDYLVSKYLGEPVARAFLEDIISSHFSYIAVELEDIQQALSIMARYNGVPLGLVDASIVALAERYRMQQILTLDRRHFSLIQPQNVDYLELLP